LFQGELGCAGKIFVIERSILLPSLFLVTIMKLEAVATFPGFLLDPRLSMQMVYCHFCMGIEAGIVLNTKL